MNAKSNKIGKKVWVLDGTAQKGFHLNSKKEYVLKEIKANKKMIWHYDYVIEDADGKTIEVPEWNVIFAFDGNLGDYLSLNDLYDDGIYENADGSVDIHIEWGDWKHDHLWLCDLMDYIDYVQTEELVTEEDGSDGYSATHTFVKKQAK